MREIHRLATAVLAVLFVSAMLVVLGSRGGVAAQATGGLFQAGKPYSLQLWGEPNSILIQVVAVSGNWITVKGAPGGRMPAQGAEYLEAAG